MDFEPPSSIPDLLNRVIASRGLSERAAAKYLGVSPTGLMYWRTGQRNPEPPSCRLIADWTGYDLLFVLFLAGWIDEADPPTTEPAPQRPEVLAEIDDILASFDLDAQRRYLLPHLLAAKHLREDIEAAPEPNGQPTSERYPRPRRARNAAGKR